MLHSCGHWGPMAAGHEAPYCLGGAEFVFVSLRNGLRCASDQQPHPLGRFSGENLRLENAQGQVGGERKGLVQCLEQSRFKKKQTNIQL